MPRDSFPERELFLPHGHPRSKSVGVEWQAHTAKSTGMISSGTLLSNGRLKKASDKDAEVTFFAKIHLVEKSLRTFYTTNF